MTVVKADGTKEEYFHTKVVGTIANLLAATGQPDTAVAEELAEAVTFFLRNTDGHREISSGEILSIIETVLAGTGYEQEAIALSEHHFQRKLKRSRLEVVSGQPRGLADAKDFYKDSYSQVRSRWDKSRIVEDLVNGNGLPRQIARTIASMVEEKVFSMCLSIVHTDLIRQLVLNDAAAVIRAQQQMQAV